MKKLVLVCVLFVFGVATVWAQGKSDLPDNVNKFLEKNYASENIKKVRIDDDKNDQEERYEVRLANGVSLEFNEAGEVTEIDGDMEIPVDALPKKISSYIQQNYSGTFVREWEMNDDGQEVELDNGIEVKFDKNGKFVKEDN